MMIKGNAFMGIMIIIMTMKIRATTRAGRGREGRGKEGRDTEEERGIRLKGEGEGRGGKGRKEGEQQKLK